MTRPRLAKLERVARDVADRARRRPRTRRAQAAPEGAAADELARRLDATRERLRREIPPARDS